MGLEELENVWNPTMRSWMWSTRLNTSSRDFDRFESPSTTAIIQGNWSGTNVTITRETDAPLRGEGSMKLAVAGGAGSVYRTIDPAKYGYVFPGHNSVSIRHIHFRATASGTTDETIQVTLRKSDGSVYRYWNILINQDKTHRYQVDLDPDNREGHPTYNGNAGTWNPEVITQIGFSNLTVNKDFYIDDIEFIYEYPSIADLVGLGTEAPVGMGDYGSLQARLNSVHADVKALEGQTQQYAKQGVSHVEVGDNVSWALELLSDFAPPAYTTEIEPGNYLIQRVRHGDPSNIKGPLAADEVDGRIYTTYQPEEDNWTEGDQMLVTFSGGYIRTDEEPLETLTADAGDAQTNKRLVTVDNAYQWQVGWAVRIYDTADPVGEYKTVATITSQTTFEVNTDLTGDYEVLDGAKVTRSVRTDLTTAVFFTQVTREATEEFRSIAWAESDHEEGDWLATADTAKWDFQNYKVGGGTQAGNIHSTVPGKVYLKETDAGDYAVRNKYTMYSKWYRAVVDLTAAFTTVGATGASAGLAIFKGTAYDANNYMAVELFENSGAVDRIRAMATIGTAAKTTYTFDTTDDAVALMIERQDRIWRVYYSLTMLPDYEWTLLAQWEDLTDAMGEQTSPVLFVENGDAGAAVQGDFDNFKELINSKFLEQMYNQPEIVPIVEKQDDPRVDQNVAGGGLEVFRIGLMDIKNGLPLDAEITEGTTTVDRYREGTDAGWVNQVGQTITNADSDGYISVVYAFPNTVWQPGDQARFILTSAIITDAATGHVYTLPPIAIYEVVGGPPNVNETQNLWLGDVIGNKWELPVPVMTGTPSTTGTASIEAYTKALVARGMAAIHGVCNIDMGVSATTIVSDDLIGYGEDYFNTGFQMIVLKNANSLTGAPEMEMRDITDYTSSSGTFIVEAFSTNVEPSDVILVIQNHLASRISAYGIADANSTAALIRDSARTEANDYWNGQVVMMLSGLARGQIRPIADFLGGTDDIVVSPDFGGVVAAGDVYAILTQQFEIVPPTADDTINYTTPQVIGRKDDTVLPLLSSTGTAMNLLKTMATKGMVLFRGSVSSEDASPTDTFYSTDLVNLADNHLNAYFYVQIVRTTDGGAPVSQVRKINDYIPGTGKFVITPVFGAAVNTGDEFVVIHESLVALGRDDASNIFSSSSVVGAINGSILERIEAIQAGLQVVAAGAAGTGWQANGSDLTLYKAVAGVAESTWMDGTAQQSLAEMPSVQVLGHVITSPLVDQDAATIVANLIVHNQRPDSDTILVAEISNADITIKRYRYGTDAGFATVPVSDQDMTIVNGGATYAYTFPSAAAIWAEGDLIQYTLQDISITVPAGSGQTFTVPNIVLYGVVGGVPVANVTTNVWSADVIGNKSDAANVAASQASIIALLRGINAALSVKAVAAGGGFEIDGSPSLIDALGTTGAVVTDSATSVLGAIGADTNNNTFSSTAVLENGDGSVLERLEELRGATSTATHNIEIANGTTEVTVADLTPIRHGVLAVEFDVATLVTAVEGGTVIVRLKTKVDGTNLRTIDRADFTVGSSEVHPTVSGWVYEGASTARVTIQVNSAVTAQRAVPYRIIEAS